MEEIINIPQWLAIVGQSGAGKGSVVKILTKLLKRLKVKFLIIKTGDMIRECIETQTYMAKKIEQVSKKGELQPDIIPLALWFGEIIKNLKKGYVIIHDGSPRTPIQFYMMKQFVDTGQIKSLKILHVKVKDENRECLRRLVVRKKREDLSIRGKSDLKKLRKKMSPWIKNGDKIVKIAKKYNMYFEIENSGPKNYKNLERKLINLFQLRKAA